MKREQSKPILTQPETALGRESPFRFRCHSGLKCFTRCCRDVNVFLTPYDIVRMKKRLGLSSEDFLHQYTITLIPERSGFPLIALRMRDEADRLCPFVGAGGCLIYEDRPWSCRMYPLDRGTDHDEYRCIADPSRCLGIGEEGTRNVQDYLDGQELGAYDEMEEALRKITSNPRLTRETIDNPKLQEMCRMALYDLDRFRRFVLESRFLSIFHVEDEMVQKIRTDDLALMKLAYSWLEFGLVSGETLKIREDILRQRKGGYGQ